MRYLSLPMALTLVSLSLSSLAASARAEGQWIGSFAAQVTRAPVAQCEGESVPVTGTIALGSWARTRATVSNLCFEVYMAGLTDQEQLKPGELDVFTYAPRKFPARFIKKRGNNYVYAIRLADLDPVLHGEAATGNRERDLKLRIFATDLLGTRGVAEASNVSLSFQE